LPVIFLCFTIPATSTLKAESRGQKPQISPIPVPCSGVHRGLSVRYLRGRRRTCHELAQSAATPVGTESTGRSWTGDRQVEKQRVQWKFRSDSPAVSADSDSSGPPSARVRLWAFRMFRFRSGCSD
jgi:hypothetical protein